MDCHLVQSSPLPSTLRLVVLLSVFTALAGLVPSAAQTKAEAPPEKRSILRLVEASAAVARKLHAQSLVGYVAIYVNESNRAALLTDSDIGPFLKFKEHETNRAAIILMSGSNGYVFCTYFREDSPVGTVALPPPRKSKITVEQIAKSYHEFAAGMLTGRRPALQLAEGNVTSDDGAAIPSYKIIAEDPTKEE